jgi:hypothetical protein
VKAASGGPARGDPRRSLHRIARAGANPTATRES